MCRGRIRFRGRSPQETGRQVRPSLDRWDPVTVPQRRRRSSGLLDLRQRVQWLDGHCRLRVDRVGGAARQETAGAFGASLRLEQCGQGQLALRIRGGCLTQALASPSPSCAIRVAVQIGPVPAVELGFYLRKLIADERELVANLTAYLASETHRDTNHLPHPARTVRSDPRSDLRDSSGRPATCPSAGPLAQGEQPPRSFIELGTPTRGRWPSYYCEVSRG